MMRNAGAALLAGTVLLAAGAPSASACTMVGDSIAVGVGAYLKSCHRNARVGLSSTAIKQRMSEQKGPVVISAGSNDPSNPKLGANLEAMRKRVRGRAIWILPRDPRARAAVLAAAHRHGDKTVGFVAGRDGVHPRSYPALAARIRSAMGQLE